MLALLLNPEDTMATALSDAAAGDTAEIILGREKTGRLVTALDAVPFGFKIAVSPMKKRQPRDQVRSADWRCEPRHRSGFTRPYS